MSKETQGVAIGAEIYVPELLLPGQNLLDQPPYYWVLESIGLPPYYFTKPKEGEPAMFAAIARQYERSSREPNAVVDYTQRCEMLVAKVYRADIPAVFQQLTDYLNREYSGSIEYLAYYWILENMSWFNRLGNPTKHCPKEVPTYAAWAYAQKLSDSRNALLGLDEVLPARFAGTESVTEALSHKHNMNRIGRFFRLVRSGALS